MLSLTCGLCRRYITMGDKIAVTYLGLDADGFGVFNAVHEACVEARLAELRAEMDEAENGQ